MKDKKIPYIEILVIAIPVMVALLQFYLYNTSDLTLWKGGGFGMYSRPHPNSFRHVWLIGEGPDGTTSYRLYPKDERVALRSIPNRTIRRNLDRIYDNAPKHKNFPSFWPKSVIRTRTSNIVEALNKGKFEFAAFPRDSIHLVVTEMELTRGYDSLKVYQVYSKKIYAEQD